MLNASKMMFSTAVGNGGKTDKYVWIQQLGELTVTIPVPKGIKTKQLDVQITNRRLKVSHKILLCGKYFIQF